MSPMTRFTSKENFFRLQITNLDPSYWILNRLKPVFFISKDGENFLEISENIEGPFCGSSEEGFSFSVNIPNVSIEESLKILPYDGELK
jgi:hypothetical protein